METIEYKNYRIEIKADSYPESPREWYNLGTMYCLHRRYDLGDDHNLSVDEVQEIAESDDYISLPIYMYDHSRISINTTGFSCPWDSGQLGIVAVSKEQVREEFKVNRISRKLVNQVYEILESEVEIYDQYLTGDVYGYEVIDLSGDSIDSCWGFFGYDHEKSGLLESARSSIDYNITEI